MFVQNQISDLKNHKTVILEELGQAKEARLVVAYVRETGVNMILKEIADKPVKLLCSLDMNITQLSAIRKLIENKVEVRVYRSNKGTFHPKIWLFNKGDKWQVLVGSANITGAAFVDNVEASVLIDEPNITANAIMFFNYLWEMDNSSPLELEDIRKLETQLSSRMRIAKTPLAQNDSEKIEKIFSFVRSWIDIPIFEKQGISALWRGWYIIPDQGYVEDNLVQKLAFYMQSIGDGVVLSESKQSQQYQSLLNIFMQQSNFKREELRCSSHQLFVRQAKNYLIKFGWAHHPLRKTKKKYTPDKRILLSTPLGERIATCQNITEIKHLYSEYFEEYLFNRFAIVKFTRRLLERLDYLDLEEFNYFVTHAHSDDELEIVYKLIKDYRSCENRELLHNKIKKYFGKTKEPTASNVYGNYVKNVKHTMSVIAWCRGFRMSEDFVISLDANGN